MKTFLAIISLSLLTACGGGAVADSNTHTTGDTAIVSPTNTPAWELLKDVPLEANESVYKASINGYTGNVIGQGNDAVARLYDACSYVVSTYKPGSDVYRNLLSASGQLVVLNSNKCVATLQQDGLHLVVN